MSHRTAKILLGLFIVNLGVALGAGLYEGRIVMPEWLIRGTDGELHWSAEAARASNTGVRFWAFVTTGPLTLLTLANAYGSWRARRSTSLGTSGASGWWRGAAAAAILERAMTIGYFIPTMVGLMNAPDSPDAVASAALWANLNYVRHALVVAALLLSLKAFAEVSEAEGRTQAAQT